MPGPQPAASGRQTLLAIYRAALAAVDGRRVVREHLAGSVPDSPVELIAIGKAAPAMARGALEAWESHVARGLVITKHGHADPALRRMADIRSLEAGHPEPDQASLAAGRELLDFLDAADADATLLFLISGGTSALVEVLPEGVDLADWRRANRWLLASGLPIDRVNAVRRALSRIKGGRLCPWLRGRDTRLLLISDVPGDDPAVIGSGLLVAPRQPAGAPGADLPDWLAALLGPVSLAPGACADLVPEIVANLDQALEAAAAEARRRGLGVRIRPERQSGEAAEAGRRCARELLGAPPGILVWGGETTVHLPPEPGRGGRCQTLALSAALELAGEAGVSLLAAGTDGSDGPGGDAGAVVDGHTLARGADAGLDPRRCLREADAGRFLEAAGDLLQTGPTGTNVTDLILGWRAPDVG